MDVLTDIVEALELRSSLYCRAEFAAPFGVAVPGDRRLIRFHVAQSGHSWIGLPSGEGTYYADGDLVLVPHGSAHVLASEPTEATVPLEELFRVQPPGDPVLRHGGPGRRVALVCGYFEFDETLVHPLVASLPPLLRMEARAGNDHAWLPGVLEAAEREHRMDQPANLAVARRLSEILFIQVLRAVLAREGDVPGLLGAVGDPQLGRALCSIHAEPGRDWSLAALSRVAGASRTVFSERFRERIGVSPMRYLTDWRMQTARRLLTDRALSVGDVARRVGYGSEAAFNRAFRDAVGEPPGRHRRSLDSRVR